MIENYVNKITQGNCLEVMAEMPESSIDLVCTSPPYGVNIDYDVYDDNTTHEEYMDFSKKWLTAAYRVLKDDGRICLNLPYEINIQDRGGRIYLSAEIWMLMKEIGYGWFGLVDLNEKSSHRSKTTAWGSWMSASCAYIYNPKETLILAYKKSPKKLNKGISQWASKTIEIDSGDGILKKKITYDEPDKKEFMKLVFGQWDYFADTKSLTKATFSSDIPANAIKILTYRDDIVLDPFTGSGTTCLSAKILGRKYIGIELSETYANIARDRVALGIHA